MPVVYIPMHIFSRQYDFFINQCKDNQIFKNWINHFISLLLCMKCFMEPSWPLLDRQLQTTYSTNHTWTELINRLYSFLHCRSADAYYNMTQNIFFSEIHLLLNNWIQLPKNCYMTSLLHLGPFVWHPDQDGPILPTTVRPQSISGVHYMHVIRARFNISILSYQVYEFPL